MTKPRPPSFSRTGLSSLLGKLDAELPKQKIAGITLAELQRQAATVNLTLAEFIRLVLDAQVVGVDTLRSIHDERLKLVVGMGLNKEQGR